MVTRSAASRQAAQALRISEYLYGPRKELFPHHTTLDFSAVQVHTISIAMQAPSSALPIGMKLPENQLASSQVPPPLYPSLAHSVLAVVHAEAAHCDDLLGANAAGFVWVSHVDAEKGKLTLLTPAPLGTTSPILLSGSLKWSSS